MLAHLDQGQTRHPKEIFHGNFLVVDKLG